MPRDVIVAISTGNVMGVATDGHQSQQHHHLSPDHSALVSLAVLGDGASVSWLSGEIERERDNVFKVLVQKQHVNLFQLLDHSVSTSVYTHYPLVTASQLQT